MLVGNTIRFQVFNVNFSYHGTVEVVELVYYARENFSYFEGTLEFRRQFRGDILRRGR